jgi:hypothetical protein
VIIKKFAAALAAISVAFVAPATAQAAGLGSFSNCAGSCFTLGTHGDLTWHNRTVSVHGWVHDTGPGWTQAVFMAVQDGHQVGLIETRTADDQNARLGKDREFSFGMGDTTRPGGLDEIWVNLCWESRCNGWEVFERP